MSAEKKAPGVPGESRRENGRADPRIAREILEFIEERRVLSVAMTDGIIGCPHQEGIDYDRAASCKRGWQRLSVARRLRFRRGARRHASLANLYCAFGMMFLRGCYHQILGPRRHLPKLSNGLCRHAGAYVRLNLHLGWQAAESYVERSNAFALIPGHRVLADCWLLSSEPLKAFLSRDMRRSEGTRARRSQTISWMSYRTLWDGVSVTPILQS
jgi:hypothetical protein